MAHLKNSCQRKVSPIFFPPVVVFQWKFLLCLGLLAAARDRKVNCLLLQSTVNAKLGSPLSLYFGFNILQVFSSLFCVF